MIDTISNWFSKKQDSKEIDTGSSKFLSIIKESGGSNELINFLSENGIESKNILKQLKKILYFRAKPEGEFFFNGELAIGYQIAKILGLKKIISDKNTGKEGQKYHHKTGITVVIDKQDKGLFLGQGQGKEIGINSINKDYIFLNFNEKNIGEILNQIMDKSLDTNKVIGFSSSLSILDANRFAKYNLIQNICKFYKRKTYKSYSDDELMKILMTDSKSMDFNKAYFMLKKSQDMLNPMLLKQLNVPINIDQIKKALGKFLGIINAMTEKEKQHVEILNHTRMQRIADGSRSTLDQVMLMVNLMNKFKTGNLNLDMSQMNNPDFLQNMLAGMKK